MKQIFTLLSLLFAFGIAPVSAQTAEYRLMHQGNRAFRSKQYDKATTYYLQALRQNPQSSRATFNLADTYLAKGDGHAADSLYDRAAKLEKNKQIRAMAYHNRGYIRQVSALKDQEAQQQLLRQAIDFYKQALRLNPRDNDTRYNLALCQKQLKNSPDPKKQEQQQDKQQQQQQQQKQQQQQQKQQQSRPSPAQKRQTEQYLNLARQAERRALEKIKSAQPRQRSLDKNW